MTIWHPFTQEKTAAKPVEVLSGEGAYLTLSNREKYLDMVSSWWVNIHGHCNKEIAEAIYQQALTLEHVIFAGFTHSPAETLCFNLKKHLPALLTKFFFSDNGSTAVEVALKMAYQFFKNQKKERNVFINLEGAYHGDTLGAMSAAGNDSKYHSTFSEFFFQTFTIDFPENEEAEGLSLQKLRNFLETNKNKVCAMILEPLVQGAAGMRMYSPRFLEKISVEARNHGVLVIFDEIMTGFCRTGKMFSMDYIKFTPDILCVSKGITGGFLPLSLTITTDQIYQAFFSDDWKKAFIHGHSYTANPIACAAAVKSLEILERRETLNQIQMISETHKRLLSNIPNVFKQRSLGTISAFDVKNKEIAAQISQKMFKEHNIIVRPIENTVYLIPPYCISISDLERCYRALIKTLS